MNFLKRNAGELLAISIFAVANGGVIYLQSTTAAPSAVQDFILKSLSVFLSVAIGFWAQKIASRQDIKSYVFSAFRRIADINKSVARVKREVNLSYAKRDFEVTIAKIDAISDEISDTVRSSMYDWADILGEEFEIIRKIERLEEQKASILVRDSNLEGTDVQVEKLVTRVNELKETLPPEFDQNLEYDFTRWIKETPLVEEQLEWDIEKNKSLDILIDCTLVYPQPTKKFLTEADAFFLREGAGAGSMFLDIESPEGQRIGIVDKENLPYSMYDYKSYYHALKNILEKYRLLISTGTDVHTVRNMKFNAWHPLLTSRFFLKVSIK